MCGYSKPLTEFHKAKKHPDGLDYRCKQCCKEYKKEHREENKNIYYERTEKYRSENRDKALLYAAKHRAKQQGLPFDIDMTDVVIPTCCPVLGIELKFNKDKVEDDSPSIDKIIPSLGYVKGNVCVISNRANKIKTNADPYELRMVADWLEEKYSEALYYSRHTD